MVAVAPKDGSRDPGPRRKTSGAAAAGLAPDEPPPDPGPRVRLGGRRGAGDAGCAAARSSDACPGQLVGSAYQKAPGPPGISQIYYQ